MSCKKELRVILVKKKGRFWGKIGQCFCFFTKKGRRRGEFGSLVTHFCPKL